MIRGGKEREGGFRESSYSGRSKLFGGRTQSLARGFKVWRKLKMVREVHAGHQDGKRI